MLPTRIEPRILFSDTATVAVTRIVIVDPQFDAYRLLAAEARHGRYDIHFRASGAVALKLLSKWRADAVIVGGDLDDMSGLEFIDLLGSQCSTAGPDEKVPLVLMAAASDNRTTAENPAWIWDSRATLAHPITWRDIEDRVRAARGNSATRISAVMWAMNTMPVSVSMAVITLALLLRR